MESGHSDVTTEGVRVRVGGEYAPEQSDPSEPVYVYTYRVVVTNEGDAPVQLLSRHWVIRDAENEQREVRGPGVVGVQPKIEPGESFEYRSHCPLPTEWGTMEGSFRLRRDDGSEFEAAVGRFFLARTVAPIESLSGD